uniref:CBM20 domain-containing protein n=1 Tax=Tetraselmis sp. GSL018 TaxID=582737 RepID=A0A061QM02_9CHLO|eukprot:CAMPEP_0177627706 /NCGR_PEP_ID=MMETSP0419_2-20121207/31347_1 /TAXON_ID=582737 /ORGANISM="Tetraselmis sp., Strain GSL018" /LENGTH=316 /DNA_ID=CAMNT_0019128879 /DNA_START=255 /DNA_END=1205 /DNA_ORIENTATION=+
MSTPVCARDILVFPSVFSGSVISSYLVQVLAQNRGSMACFAVTSTSNNAARPSSGRDLWSKPHGHGGTEGYEDEDPEEAALARAPDQQQFLEFPKVFARQVLRYNESDLENEPKVKVRLSVHYKCYNRQMLCIGGSNIPFGWSFLSIAKVPMSWTEGDVWTTEVEVPVGTRLEYKYVILEEQDWTKQENEDAEGVVTTFRVSPGETPDVQSITKKMAIVAWQPGPNRILVVPQEEEFAGMVPGEVREREPGPSRQERLPPDNRGAARNDVVYGTWEAIMLEEDSTPVLERRDVWGYGDWNARQSQGSPNPRNRFGS